MAANDNETAYHTFVMKCHGIKREGLFKNNRFNWARDIRSCRRDGARQMLNKLYVGFMGIVVQYLTRRFVLNSVSMPTKTLW